MHFNTEIPPSPYDFIINKLDYHKNFSSLLLLWNLPADPSLVRIDYYYLQVEYGESITGFNVTGTSATISGLPYSKNITLSLTACNCINKSIPLLITESFGNLA